MTEQEYLLDQIRKEFQKTGAHINQLAEEQNRIRQVINQHAAVINQRTSGHSSAFEEITKYNNIVMTVGYAGFFGLWSLVKETQPIWPMTFAMAALCGTISLFVFVIWEVLTMGARTVVQSDVSPLIGPDHWLRRRSQSLMNGLDRAWPFQYLLALAAGVAGYACLAVVLVAQLCDAF